MRGPGHLRATLRPLWLPALPAPRGRARRRLRGFALRGFALAAVLAVLAAACSSSPATSTPPSTSSSSPTAATRSEAGATTGVSAHQVTVGNVSILSGPVPGLFEGAPFGAEAFFAYQNSLGGVFGRKLVLDSRDDGFSCTQNQALTQSLSSTAFAFVGSFSVFDNCGGRVIAADRSLADVSETLDAGTQALPNVFQPQTVGTGWRTGPLAWYRQHYPASVGHVGAIVSNVALALAEFHNWEAAAVHEGFHVSVEADVNPLQTDFTAEVLRMRQAGVRYVIIFEDIGSVARILNSIQLQGWHPDVVTTAGDGYDNRLFSTVDPGAAANLLSDLTFSLYLGGDAKQVPEVALMLHWLARTHPGFTPDVYTLYGWASAMLFTQALEAAGPDPTRPALVAALSKIHTFSANGLLATSDPAGRVPATCWVMVGVKGSSFYRITPPAGYRCQPGGYFDNPSGSGGG